MKDYRTPLMVAVPAAVAVVAVLWILRRKSDKKPNKSGDGSSIRGTREEVMASMRNVAVEKEGITITQRKIPDTTARDRGDADVAQHCAPDSTGGPPRKSSPPISVNGGSRSRPGVVTEDEGVEQKVEQMVVSAMGDGLQEAKSKILVSGCTGEEEEEEDFDEFDDGAEVSFDCSRTVKNVRPENVVACSSTATVGFSTGEDGLQTGIGGVNPTGALQSTEVCPSVGSEEAAIGESQSSPQHQASFFNSKPSITQDTNMEHYIADSLAKPTEQSCNQKSESKDTIQTPEAASNIEEVRSESQANKEQLAEEDNDMSRNDDQTSAPQTPASPLSPARSISVTSLRRQHQLQSKSSLESQASLGSDDIDSLWGIKPNTSASSDWGKQLSLDGNSLPTSPLVRTATTVATTSLSSTSQTSGVEASRTEAELKSKLEAATDDSGKASLPSEGAASGECPLKPHSPACDSISEGSNDSGRGGSEHDAASVGGSLTDSQVEFDFNMPSELCGRFIGRLGKNINFIKSKTGAKIFLTNNPFSADYQICQVKGTQAEVDSALSMIRRKFPLQDFPMLTMVPLPVSPAADGATPDMQQSVVVPDVMQLSLPEGVSVDVYVSAVVDAGHVFVQQPTHPSFMSLEKLTFCLNNVYGSDTSVPSMPMPLDSGVICVVENEGYWYRAMTMSGEDSEGNAQIKFVDYGGYTTMPVTALKQIRADFMTLPFQAVECFLANITPLQGSEYYSEDATTALSEMTSYKLLQCQVVARSEGGLPYVHLYSMTPGMNTAVLLNRSLVNNQHARWVEIL